MIGALTVGALALGATYWGFKKKDPSIQLGSCFFDRLATPIYTFLNEYHSNAGLLVDYINDDNVILNTKFGNLYGIELASGKNIHQFVPKNVIDNIISNYKTYPDASLYYIIHKQGKWHKQYLLSYNKAIIRLLSEYYDSNLLSGKELINIIHDLFLQNSFVVNDDKKIINRHMVISKDFAEQEPEFMSFKRAIRQSLYKSLNEIDLFQGFKNTDNMETNLLKLFEIDFEGSVWFLFDFCESRIKTHINKLINETKLAGNKAPFIELKNLYNSGDEELCIVNSVAFLKKYSEDTIASIGDKMKISYIPRELFRADSIKKTLLKQRDIDFDFLVKSDYLYNFIASCHKKNTKKADIYGIDKNGGFVNYSFSAENNNPHSVIIARPGSGKSVSKQKIMAQMIKLDFATGKAHNLGSNPGNVKIRSYDIGFSDEKFIKILKDNSENNVAHVESSYSDFRYNLISVEMPANKTYNQLTKDEREIFEADIVFASELAALIYSEANGGGREGFSADEIATLKNIIKELYIKKEYTQYRVKLLSTIPVHMESYQRIIELGYSDNDCLQNIKEPGFEIFKKPLISDAIKIASIYAESKQIRAEEAEIFKSLVSKLRTIEKQEIFSTFDKIEITEADVLSMDLNNFKESSLFVPIFFCIFQKTYLRDREYALTCKRSNRAAPKLFYAIEEAKNFFRNNKVFEEMFDKVTLEARKYNVHLCFIVQNADHLPVFISKNIDTRIFLLTANQKAKVLEEANEIFGLDAEVREAISNTNKYEMCIWYSAGVFHMRFEIPEHEMKVFNTNPNEA